MRLRSTIAHGALRNPCGQLRLALDSPRRLLLGGGASLIGLWSRMPSPRHAGRLSASRLLARLGLPTPKIARRMGVAQDAVRMLGPGGIGLPRGRRGRKLLPAGTTGRPGGRVRWCGSQVITHGEAADWPIDLGAPQRGTALAPFCGGAERHATRPARREYVG
jgi:hypothetical protein